MSTYYCFQSSNGLSVGILKDQRLYKQHNIQSPELAGLVRRRDQKKLPKAAIMAGVLFEHFTIPDLIRSLGGDPNDTPLVICNRYANWDYVEEMMAADPVRTANNVDSYVATAWFPAAVQGYLTIRYDNKGQAITLATKDIDVIGATVECVRPPEGVAILASFETVPSVIGGSPVIGDRPKAFGALSLITREHTPDQILELVKDHQMMYRKHPELRTIS